MKVVLRLLLPALMLVGTSPGQAQRYLADVFPQLKKTSDIVYGFAANPGDEPDTLRLDLFEPEGDTASQRPLFILIHGGSFRGGSRKDESIVDFAEAFARKGYVTASISYRLSDRTVLDWDTFVVDTLALFEAAHAAMHDAKAAVRYFRKTADQHRINTSQISIGGLSAGGITAVSAGYIDRPEELFPDALPPTVEGDSGNEGFSSEVSSVVSLCGGAVFPSALDGPDAPRLFIAHDRGDPAVPFEAANSLYAQAVAMGVPVRQEFFDTNWHCSWSDPIWGVLTGSRTKVLTSLTTFLAEPLVAVAAMEDLPSRRSERIEIYPNPVQERATVVVPGARSESVAIFDLLGRKIRSFVLTDAGRATFNRHNLPSGTYLLVYREKSGQMVSSRIVLR
jgi:acetyl esterase/lipase